MMFSFMGKKPEPEVTGPSAVELVRAKLTACDLEIASAEDELRRVSLAAALGDEANAGMHAVAKLTELRTRKDLLSDALRAALDAEKEAAGRLGEREYQARKRSLAQKIGQFTRDATALTEALAGSRDAYRRMAETAGSIFASLPEPLREEATGLARRLSPGQLRELATVETTRLSDGGLAAPGARQLVAARDENGDLPTLAETITELCGDVRAGFERCAPLSMDATPEQPRDEVEAIP